MTMYRFLICAAVCLLCATAYAASTTHVVDQAKLRFSVGELRIKRGDTVKFTNSDRPAHNILVGDGPKALSSGLQQPGQPFEVPFTETGTFPVACGIHPKMTMKVIVE